jgi:hypothetical protein
MRLSTCESKNFFKYHKGNRSWNIDFQDKIGTKQEFNSRRTEQQEIYKGFCSANKPLNVNLLHREGTLNRNKENLFGN